MIAGNSGNSLTVGRNMITEVLPASTFTAESAWWEVEKLRDLALPTPDELAEIADQFRSTLALLSAGQPAL
jgi:hypothetical protein